MFRICDFFCLLLTQGTCITSAFKKKQVTTNSQSCRIQSFSVSRNRITQKLTDPTERVPVPEHWAKLLKSILDFFFPLLPRFSSGMKTRAPATQAPSTVIKVNTCSTFSTSSSQTEQEINLHVRNQLPYQYTVSQP